MKLAKQITSLLLTLALLLTMGGFAEDEVVVTEAPAPEVVEEAVEEPAPEPEPVPTPEPAEVPTEEPVEDATQELPQTETSEAPEEVEIPALELPEVPTAEPTEVPLFDPNPVPTEEPAEESVATFKVAVERIGDTLLHAIVVGAEGEFAYHWQAMDAAAYLEALLAGELPDAESLWLDISGTNGDTLDVMAAMGEEYAKYNYRCVVSAGDRNAVSAEVSFADELDQEAKGANDGIALISSDTDFVISEDGTLKDWNGKGSYLSIPAYLGIKKIGARAFTNENELEEVILPWTVTAIEEEAFYNCIKLQVVSIPPTVETIGKHAFAGCDLRLLEIPQSVKTLGDGAFNENKNLGAVNFTGDEPQLTKIGVSAFAGCNLSAVTLPSSIQSIGDSAFKDNEHLKSIDLPEGLGSIGGGAFAGALALTSVTLPSTLTGLGSGVFRGDNSLETIDFNGLDFIREETKFDIVTWGDGAFSGCGVKSITIPGNIKKIPEYFFGECPELTTVTISEGVETIGRRAFDKCPNLTAVNLPKSLKTIGEFSFRGCKSLAAVDFPVGLEIIGGGAFGDCDALETVVLPMTMHRVQAEAFAACDSLRSVDMECRRLYELGEKAFAHCQELERVKMPLHISVRTSDAFQNSEKVTLQVYRDSSVASDYEFYDNNIEYLDIVKVKKIQVDPQPIYMRVGDSMTLNATVLPEDATYNYVGWMWISSEPGGNMYEGLDLDYGTDDDYYKNEVTITAEKEGRGNLYCISSETRDLYDPASVVMPIQIIGENDPIPTPTPTTPSKPTPTPTPTPIPGVTIEYPTELTLTVGESSTPKASSSVDKGFTYTSSEIKTVTVSTTGKITAKKAGSAVITVTGKTSRQTATCTVTVLAKPTKVTVSAHATQMYLDEGTLTLTAAVEPENALQDVTWKTSDAKIATVKDGVVTPVKDGSVTIMATAVKKNAKGKAVSGSVKITIVDRYKPTGIALEPSEAQTLAWNGATLTLKPVLTPVDAQSDVTWKSSNTKIATVKDGVVTSLKKEGTVTITATTVKKNVKGKTMSASVKVTVADPEKPVKISLNQSGTIEQPIDAPLTLTAAVQPETAVQDVTWKSSNAAVVKILDKATGVLSLEGAGTATITATTVKKNAGGKALSASVKVTVIDPYRPASLKLQETGTQMLAWEGATLQLHPVMTAQIPENEARSGITWKSSNAKIATVDENGLVTPLKREGTVTITATTVKTNVKGKTMSASVKVTVFDPERPTKIALNQPSKIACQIDQPPQLIATMEPATAKSELKWKSSNTSVAAVDASGVVTLKSAGSAKITVTTAKTNVSTKKAMSASVTITVTDPYRPAGIKLAETGTQRLAWDGATLELHPILTPEIDGNVAQSDISWKSSDAKIATVDANGVVTSLKKEGTVTITATTVKANKKGKKMSATVKVKVEDPTRPEALSVTPEALDLDVNAKEGAQLTASVSRAEGAAESGYSWSSSNAKVAKVSADGTVTPVKVGTVTITVKAAKKTPDGKTLSQKVTVRVYDPAIPFSASLQESGTQAVKAGETLTLHAEVFPSTAETKLSWSSSNKSVATVEDGVVTGKKAGTVTITVATANGKKASVKVKVEK